MNIFRFTYIIILTCVIHVGNSQVSAQGIVDRCFYSAGSSENFSSGGDISNSGDADIGYYNGSSWSGTSLGVSSPFVCNNPRAIRISADSSPADAVGFRLNGNLNNGDNIEIDCKTIKTEGNFTIGIYTSNSGSFYDGGTTPVLITTINANFNDWTNLPINSFVNGASNGHNWIFIKAETGTGIFSNFCQGNLTIPTVDLGPDVEICDGSPAVLDATSNVQGASYEWQNGSTNPTISAGNEGTYSVEVSNSCGSSTDDLELTVLLEPELNVKNDTIVCDGSIILLEAPGINATYLWSDGSTGNDLSVDSAGIYSVDIIDDCFTTTDIVEFFYMEPLMVDLGPDTAVCGGTVDYSIANGGSTSEYTWNTGSSSPTISITETGNYTVSITNMCSTVSDDVYVEFSYPPGDFLPNKIEFCEGRDMVLDLTHIEGSFTWSDGPGSSYYDVPNPGYHFVEIIDDDSCFVVADTVLVIRKFCDCPVHLPNSFTPNNDGINEEFGIVFECPPYDYQLTIIDRWGQVMFDTNNPNITWSGRNKYGNKVSTGMYTYILKYTESFQGILSIKKGSVVLMKD